MAIPSEALHGAGEAGAAGESGEPEEAKDFRRRFHAMGSPCEIILRSGNQRQCRTVLGQMQTELRRLEQQYSRFLPDSLTTRINKAAGSSEPVPIDEETSRLLDYADTCYRQSNGLFDITSGALRRLWNYQDLAERQALPETRAVAQALEKVGWHKVVRDNDSVLLPVQGMEIDFGGIVKEYAADCLAGIARQAGIAAGLVELGGDIRIIGLADSASPWEVGIRDPFQVERALARIFLPSGALASSGDYERYVVIQGKKYSHILNPLTGWPVAGFSSVSVVADQCVIAGTAASIAVLMEKRGEAWLQELGLPYLCVDQDGGITGTIPGSVSSGERD